MDLQLSLSFLVGVVSSILFLVVRSYLTTYSFWRKRGIKGPTPWPFFGNSWELIFGEGNVIDWKNAKKYGRIYGTYQGSKPILIVNDASVLEEIYVKNFSQFMDIIEIASPDPIDMNNIVATSGDDWKRHRSVFTHGLTTSKVKMMFQYKDSKDILKYIDGHNGREINMYNMFTLDILNVILRGLYGLDMDLFNNRDHPIVKKAQKFFAFTQGAIFMTSTIPIWILKLFRFSFFDTSSSDYIKQLIQHAVKERIKNPDAKKNDLLQTLLNAEKETPDGKGLTEIEVISNAIVSLAAGFDSSAITMSFVAFLLAKNLDKQKLVQKEIDSILNNNQKLEYEDLNKFVYLEAAIMETLRFLPIDHRQFRRVSNPNGTNLPGTDIHLHYGTIVNSSPHVLHHDPEYWPEPGLFKPERFLPENKQNIVNCSNMTFGAGPRMCPGIRFALVNIKHTLIEILRKYSFETCPATLDVIRFKPGSMINNATNIQLKIVKKQ